MAIVYIGLGSNLGNRDANIQNALLALQENGIRILKTSSIIETDPVGGPPQPRYLNGVLQGETVLSPHGLLSALKKIEIDLGRTETVRNGPRIIDLDILLYNDIVLRDSQLIIPHPRMFERDFVVKPLKEIAPDLLNKLTYANNKVN